MELKSELRTILGKKVNALRAKGIIPGEIFGHGRENVHVSISEKEFNKLFKNAGTHTIFTLAIKGGENIPVLVSNIATNPISQKIITVDFHQIRMDEAIQTEVPIEFIGEAPAVKLGLTILKIHNKIPIEALPAHIPQKITIDISKLTDADMSIGVEDITISKNVKVLLPTNTVLVTVGEKAKEEIAPVPVKEGGEANEGKETKEGEKEASPDSKEDRK